MIGFFNDLFSQSLIDFPVVLLRLTISTVIGGVIGFEREIRDHPAGFRTHILISIGSTLLMLLSIYIPQTYQQFQNGDPSRIAAQVVTGIGFLGAGAILRLGVNVRGLTTAASIWVVAGIGLAIGGGMYLAAVTAAVFTLLALVFLDVVKKHLTRHRSFKFIKIFMKTDQMQTKEIYSIFRSFSIQIKSADISQSFENRTVNMELFVKIPEKVEIQNLYNRLKSIDGLIKVTMRQDI